MPLFEPGTEDRLYGRPRPGAALTVDTPTVGASESLPG